MTTSKPASSSNKPFDFQLRPSEVKEALRIACLLKMPMMIWGAPGIGKSDIVRQIADELGYQVLDIRLSQMEPTDMRGIPIPVNLDGIHSVVWASPDMLPRDPEAKIIILLDELPNAAPSVQAAAYQLVLDRKLGEYVLPKNCVVFAAGNRETDRGNTFRMPSPLLNRFDHIEMTHDFDDWFEWAMVNDIHPSVIAFLLNQKDQLFVFEPNSASRGFATPRTWSYVSQLLNAPSKASIRVLQAMIAGAVGQESAIKFYSFLESSIELPNPRDIIEGKITTLEKKFKPSALWNLTVGLVQELRRQHVKLATYDFDNETWLLYIDRVLFFYMKNLAPEYVVLGGKFIFASKINIPIGNKDYDKLKSWPQFESRYAELILK